MTPRTSYPSSGSESNIVQTAEASSLAPIMTNPRRKRPCARWVRSHWPYSPRNAMRARRHDPATTTSGIALPGAPQDQFKGERARHDSNDHSTEFLSSLHAQPRSVQPEEGHNPERDDGGRKQRSPTAGWPRWPE